MRALQERAEALARAAQRRRVDQIAEQWREALPGASISATATGVAIEAPGLGRRWLAEPTLRFAGRLGR